MCLAATLVLLLAHAWLYAFLTDDAYISFRYARNLVDGHGLVFNPGFEHVEGYTNFLWVLLLALLHRFGPSLEVSAYVLSFVATAGLWAGVVALAVRGTPRERMAWVCLPPFLLAMTRSVAVWSTSGLETRAFECLIVLGALRLLIEDERLRRDAAAGVRPWAAILFALATWTRPDGLLISLCAFGAVVVMRLRELTPRLRWIALSAAGYGGLVGAHFLFRFAYYGAWLPNTYYAKVSGRQWWDMGLAYLGSCFLEYGAWLWIPFLVAAWWWHRRRSTLVVPVLFAAIVLPHAIYVASIGGDHFEYRPLDLYFPFFFLLIGDGAMQLARSRRGRVLTLAGLAVLGLALVELPYRSHREFPRLYASGFPGLLLAEPPRVLEAWAVAGDAERFLDPGRSALYRLPLLDRVARAHRDLLRRITRHFVGIRQEEHALFLARASAEADALRELIDEGRIPRDTYVAIDCVGVIPFRTDLRTLDRLGLTDAVVARGEFSNPEIMAHGKYASPAYARQQGVDLWATDNVRLVWRLDDPKFLEMLVRNYAERGQVYLLSLGDGRFLVAGLPQGLAAAQARFPSMDIRGIDDPAAMRQVLELGLPYFLEALQRNPEFPEAHVTAGVAYFVLGDAERAEASYRRALALDPRNGPAHTNLAVLLAATGRLAEAVPHLREGIRLAPDEPQGHVNLGKVLLALGDPAGAAEAFRAALALDPEQAEARRGLAAVEALERGAPVEGEEGS